MDFHISSLKTLASFDAAKIFWDASFKTKNLQLGEIKDDGERSWEKKLTICRKEAVQKLIDFFRKKLMPSVFEIPFRENILLLHKAYHQLFLWKITYDPSNRIDLLKKGELYAPNFFTLDGEFNDISWTKRFVHDTNYSLTDRFSLACSFWLEDESKNLWFDLKLFYGHNIANDLNFLVTWDDHSAILLHRILMLELQFSNSRQYQQRQPNLWRSGFELAVLRNYEHAVYFFWGKMSADEKIIFMRSVRFFELMRKDIDYPRDKIAFFLFSQLSETKKSDLMHWSLADSRFEIWYTLLISPCAKAVQSDIINFCSYMTSEMYSNILKALARRIMQLQHSSDIEIFTVLWRKLRFEEQFYVLKSGSEYIHVLAKAKSFKILYLIIGGLLRQQKVECLLFNLYNAGITVLDIISRQKEFDVFQTYLTLFLMEKDFYGERDILHIDASTLLEKFLESDVFWEWSKEENFKINEKEIMKRIYTLKTSLIILEELLDKVSFPQQFQILI